MRLVDYEWMNGARTASSARSKPTATRGRSRPRSTSLMIQALTRITRISTNFAAEKFASIREIRVSGPIDFPPCDPILFSMSAFAIQFQQGGVHLPQLGLWLDAHEPQTGPEKVFVSHAHSDHTGFHREVISTAATARFMQARMGAERVENILPFHESRCFDSGRIPFHMKLLPAGHIFGSAMSWIGAEGQSL